MLHRHSRNPNSIDNVVKHHNDRYIKLINCLFWSGLQSSWFFRFRQKYHLTIYWPGLRKSSKNSKSMSSMSMNS